MEGMWIIIISDRRCLRSERACQFGIQGCGISVQLKAFTPFGIPALWVWHPGVQHFGPAFSIPGFGIPGLRHSGCSAFTPYFRSAFRPFGIPPPIPVSKSRIDRTR